MKKQVALAVAIACGSLSSLPVMSNEAPTTFGNRSWQWRTPDQTLILQRSLLIHCQGNPDSGACGEMYDGNGVAGASGAIPGTGSTGVDPNGTAAGNLISIGVDGDNNTIIVEGDQTNSGTQEANISADGNEVILIDDQTQVYEEGSVENTTTHNTANFKTIIGPEPGNVQNEFHYNPATD